MLSYRNENVSCRTIHDISQEPRDNQSTAERAASFTRRPVFSVTRPVNVSSRREQTATSGRIPTQTDTASPSIRPSHGVPHQPTPVTSPTPLHPAPHPWMVHHRLPPSSSSSSSSSGQTSHISVSTSLSTDPRRFCRLFLPLLRQSRHSLSRGHPHAKSSTPKSGEKESFVTEEVPSSSSTAHELHLTFSTFCFRGRPAIPPTC